MQYLSLDPNIVKYVVPIVLYINIFATTRTVYRIIVILYINSVVTKFDF